MCIIRTAHCMLFVIFTATKFDRVFEAYLRSPCIVFHIVITIRYETEVLIFF